MFPPADSSTAYQKLINKIHSNARLHLDTALSLCNTQFLCSINTKSFQFAHNCFLVIAFKFNVLSAVKVQIILWTNSYGDTQLKLSQDSTWNINIFIFLWEVKSILVKWYDTWCGESCVLNSVIDNDGRDQILLSNK